MTQATDRLAKARAAKGKMPFTPEQQAKARAARKVASGLTTEAILQDAKVDINSPAGRQIAFRVSQMPKTCIRTYLKAMRGRSAKSAIEANCSMCMGWDDFRAGVRNCTDVACSLYPYRPYQGK